MSIVVANWKLHGSQVFVKEYTQDLVSSGAEACNVNLIVCAPFPLLTKMSESLKNTSILIGAEDCSAHESGAYTGQTSAQMVKEAGATHVIVGHSECRQYLGDTDATVAIKIFQAQKAGLTPIYCVGEPLDIREAGQEEAFVLNQLQTSLTPEVDLGNLLIAYEPLWAIGTGKTATAESIASMHHTIKNASALNGHKVPILYGGSVKPDNAEEILGIESVDGVLVGGASLKMDTLMPIIHAGQQK